jgi:hypothetical protein
MRFTSRISLDAREKLAKVGAGCESRTPNPCEVHTSKVKGIRCEFITGHHISCLILFPQTNTEANDEIQTTVSDSTCRFAPSY